MPKHRTFSPELKVRIALDALHGELTSQQIASKYKITTEQVSTFKKQAIANELCPKVGDAVCLGGDFGYPNSVLKINPADHFRQA